MAEIESRRGRLSKRSSRWDLFTKRNDPILCCVDIIKNKLKDDKKEKNELMKYLPIGMVACVEGYFRLSIADLIDFGDPFQKNARALADIKLDLNVVVDVSLQRASAGELISHLLPISSMDDINRHMSWR